MRGPGQLVVQDVLAHEHADLLGPLADLEPEVHVEDVQEALAHLVAGHLEIQADAAARLAVGPGEVERAAAADGQAGEDRVAVGQAVPLPRGAHRDLHAEALGQAQGLGPEHLLDAHQVGVDLLQHLGDPVEVHAAVEPRALVDVVAGDGQGHAPSIPGQATATKKKPRARTRGRGTPCNECAGFASLDARFP